MIFVCKLCIMDINKVTYIDSSDVYCQRSVYYSSITHCDANDEKKKYCITVLHFKTS